jgi:hypothetical protein
VRFRHRFTTLLLIAAVAACSGGTDDAPPAATPMPDGLPGVYTGELPCSNCAAIEASIWVRPDGRFFLRQRYVTADGAADDAANVYTLGLWRWDETEAELVLAARGPERRLLRLDAERLELMTASPVAHVLVRDPAAPPFTDRVRLDGESAIVDGNGTFKECLTGLALTVAKSGAFDELRRQHRRMNRSGRITLTAVDAHLAEGRTADAVIETLIIDRVVDLTPGVGC